MINLTAVVCYAVAVLAGSACAQTWTVTSASTAYQWTTVASSADGSRIIAGSTASRRVYTSTNSGATWISNNLPFIEWVGVASSADGTALIAASSSGPVYLSTNSGALWSTSNVPSFNWGSAASSADGRVLAIVQSADTPAILVSTNAGANWNSNRVSGMPAATVACPADGSKVFMLTAGSFNASTNAGVTWTHLTHVGTFNLNSPIATSADGSQLAVAFNNDGIYTSTNSGVTWKSNPVPVLAWRSIATSADGRRLAAGIINGGIYSSTNSGLTWQADTAPTEFWNSIATSADGSKRVAATTGGGIWKSAIPPAPELKIGGSAPALTLSWIVPSTNLVLQQNLDLSTTNWTTISNAPTLDLARLEYDVTLPPTNAAAFFRLKVGP